MAQKIKTFEVILKESEGAFSIFRQKGVSKQDYEFSGLSALRQLLSNERARILNAIKTKNPGSIYQLSKILGRNFKSVFQDIKLLERFGFIELVEERTKNRTRHKPEIAVNRIVVNIDI